ncbi:uncharacterized protein LOC111023848 [Momordica charantia]|uniref:pectinesterase n=1 Tax=Momordica charantia TaxID=3673 RepID=A0A6J1DWQ8_MOMCH|nr:uncharacterized protein LOC111023848 [Momordica charantia]
MEHYSKGTIWLIPTLLFACLYNVSNALACELNYQNPYRVAYSIVVNKFGRGNFRTIQSAIDSIPFGSTKWIRVQISAGTYWEKVTIPKGKSCIFIDGAGSRVTEIQWNDHQTTATSATFTSFAENLVVRGIAFRNTYNAPGSVRRQEDIAPAVAALIMGDKASFYECRFIGLQDTLWDGPGRHHFVNCYIEGVIDVISGSGQSIYEKCMINVPIHQYAPILSYGYITAQGKENPNEGSGFVFNACSVVGNGRVYLGRAYRPFSTVIFHNSFLAGFIDPAGWNPWGQVGHETSLTYAELNCRGPGANISRRVPWLKRLHRAEIRHFTDISFIDQEALDCQLNFRNPYRVAYSIYVSKKGRANFRTVQSAIDSIPFNSTQWIRVQIGPGIYWEKVVIPAGKTCIFLDGADNRFTEIQWNDHQATATSATFTSFAENLLVKGITFKNTYNTPGSVRRREDIEPALAVLIEGDKASFYECRFIGLQDTLWDGTGRHHFVNCYIEGVIDIISGSGQSIYEKCKINVPIDQYSPILSYGYITAQGKENPNEGSGFVFNACSVVGNGRVYLGRAYRPFSTVIFHNSFLAGFIDPAGWDPWEQVGHERDLTYAEANCIGPGADTSRRVPWLKRLSAAELKYFSHISFIDQDGWTSRLPIFA